MTLIRIFFLFFFFCPPPSSCKEYQNFNAFLAIIMGLNNQAVSRLSLTWEKLPNKFRKMFTEFELIVDSSRNHRAYRAAVGKLQPPVLPFLPLLVKGELNYFLSLSLSFFGLARNSCIRRKLNGQV